MIAVDTSALLAIVLNEKQADACVGALESQDRVLISAGTLAEALLVAARRNVEAEIDRMVEALGFEVVNVTAATARRVALAYRRWGRWCGTAGLNFGDCFAYVIAHEHGCPLLYFGRDFAKTDVESVLNDR